ncbi:MAG: OB-fold nucleic acid binding domain-containing protein [Candidatus Nanoarchaeia archaeon]|nr:OB-fold nucleic acid binding domain-containing protein [Candidatus Nanoarchaeia archaeon]MDD5238971.1 OB-fold nucleic acid binding domain-containing protein [Candidatus Nanoarchaeia archaeon]
MTKRWTAYKMHVKDVVNGNYTGEGFISFGQWQVNRVRIMGTVVQKFISEDNGYGFFIIDDSTETVRVRSFKDSVDLIKMAEIGDMIDVFGRVRKYEEEIYVIPEILRKVDEPNFYILRKLELKKQDKRIVLTEAPKKEEAKPAEQPDEIVEEVIDTGEKKTETAGDGINPRRKVVDCIAGFDKGEGVEVDKLMKGCGLSEDIVERVLTDLMNEGEIFEPRAGKVKILG